MIKCDADIIECARGWQAEICPLKYLTITSPVFPTKEKLKVEVEKQLKKLHIEIINWVGE